jgi:hypothetical protein
MQRFKHVTAAEDKNGKNSAAGQGLLMLFMQDALQVKKALSKAQNAGGVNPVKALQRRARPF